MIRNAISTCALIVLFGALSSSAHVADVSKQCKKSPVDVVLDQLNAKTRELQSYECRIEHKYVQPLVESQTIRKGILYYIRSGGKSALKVDFTTIRQEDEK